MKLAAESARMNGTAWRTSSSQKYASTAPGHVAADESVLSSSARLRL
jgi:hypothetical protein